MENTGLNSYPPIVNTKQLAEILGVSGSAISMARKAGKFPNSTKGLGKGQFLKELAINEFHNNRSRETASPDKRVEVIGAPTEDNVRALMEIVEAQNAQGDKAKFTLAQAKLMNEAIKAQDAWLDLKKKQGILILRADAENQVSTITRNIRDLWLVWPERIAVEMGSELGVDPALLHSVLAEYVRKNLIEGATMEIKLPAPPTEYDEELQFSEEAMAEVPGGDLAEDEHDEHDEQEDFDNAELAESE